MNMLWQRLNDHGKNWRHVYKSLTLMDYLIKNGSEKVIQHCREGYRNLQTLKDFQHVDEAGKDQGYYIREKSKQVITLLMDEQLLHREREVACRTRRRTSYSMTFPKRLPGTENTSKAGQKQEQCQDIEVPSGTVLSQETLPVEINAWKLTEDLMLFCEDDPKPVLPIIPTSIISSTAWLSEGQTDVYNLLDTDAVPVPSEKSPSLQTNENLDKNVDSTITKTITGSPLQMPLEKQPAAKSCDTLATLPAHWPSSQEEFTGPHLRTSKSDSTFRNQASVETLYVSPSFTTFDPMKETVISKGHQEATRSGLVPMEDENLQTLATWASPEKSVHPLPPVRAGPSFWTLSRQQSSSASVKNTDKTARIRHPFAPRSPLFPDEKANDQLSLLEILPDDSGSAKEKTSSISSSDWVAFSTQNVDHFTSVSCSSSQATKGLSREPEADNSTNVLLGEVKTAIVTLHEDLSMVIRELNVISSRLVSMSGPSPHVSRSLQFPQCSEAGSDQVE
ncbi:hypothetical protein MJG53_003921 [Ovis ammon polii x Ovis aries]|uniref:Uncharacterized protein n=1 Tax=Ovis ammon polii x Ovis aries TaxID=2918886 RepID=A0ACB9V991_9CETA|nr:hypothetical protein MJG53_003921 [Ovis ammon polii x Ovis aries]